MFSHNKCLYRTKGYGVRLQNTCFRVLILTATICIISAMTNNVSFGKRIQQLRQAKDISQRELAKKAHMDFTYLSKIENDRMPPPREDVIKRLSEFLNADLNELLILAGKPPSGLAKSLETSESARRFFRHAPKLSGQDWDRIMREIEKDEKK